jgi:hypothetical protein
MASTITAATLTVRITEEIDLNGSPQGASNTLTISNINEISKRIVTVTSTEASIAAFSAAVGAGTYIAANVRYMRLTNKDDSNFIYLVFKNEYSNEFCVKLDYGQSFIYNADQTSGIIDTMLANQVALGFTEGTGRTADGSDDVTNITATNRIIPGLRYAHDNANPTAGSSVGAVTGGNSTNGYEATAHTLVTRNATTGAESVANIVDHVSGASDTDGTGTYSAGFGDLVEITAEADTGTCDLEMFIASI